MDPTSKDSIGYGVGLVLICGSVVAQGALLGWLWRGVGGCVVGGSLAATVIGLVQYLGAGGSSLTGQRDAKKRHSDDAESQDWLEQSGRRSVEVNDPSQRRTFEIREGESPEEALRRLQGR